MSYHISFMGPMMPSFTLSGINFEMNIRACFSKATLAKGFFLRDDVWEARECRP
jgi:hypothetical protein